MEEKRSWDSVKIRTAKMDANSQEDTGIKKSAQVLSSSSSVSGAGGTFFTRPLDYRPELASPDRWSYPQNIIQKNAVWRLFYELDPIAGTVIDIYTEMAMSDYDIVGVGVDGEIADDLEDMCEEIRLGQLVSTVMKEFLVIGEAVPHLFYDKDVGYWTDWSLHKQENIELLDTQLLGMDPILSLTASTEEVRELKKIMKLSESFGVDVPGRGFLSTLLANKKVPLEPLNVTFIPRLLHPYNIRGTSIFSRLWRIWMYEDSIWNACFVEGTKVTMSDFSLKNIEDVKVGDSILDRTGKKEKVINAWEELSVGDLIEIKATGGYKFTCTEKHKFPVYRNKQIYKLEAGDIVEGDYLIVSKKKVEYVCVNSKKLIEEKKLVYNLTVSGDHSYLVDGGIATFNSIQTSKRHSSPLKTVSMGDLASGFVPSEQQEQQLLQALAQAEMDPHAWILVPPGTKFDAWGTVERAMTINKEYDVIERMKLLALGTSKDFISGASTFASAQAGLQVFLSRLLAFRTFIEEVFINPKIFGVISRVRKWYVPTQAELSHKLRLNKEDRFVKPRVRWEKSLKTRVDKELLDAYSDLVERFHVKVSERTISDAAGIDWADEVRRSLQEDYLKKAIGEVEAKELGMPGGLGLPSEGLTGEEPLGGVPTEEKSLEELAPEPQYLEEEVAPMHASSLNKVGKILTNIDKENSKITRDTFLCGMYGRKDRLPKEVKEEKLL